MRLNDPILVGFDKTPLISSSFQNAVNRVEPSNRAIRRNPTDLADELLNLARRAHQRPNNKRNPNHDRIRTSKARKTRRSLKIKHPETNGKTYLGLLSSCLTNLDSLLTRLGVFKHISIHTVSTVESNGS